MDEASQTIRRLLHRDMTNFDQSTEMFVSELGASWR
jgi:hypothetical protein